jgi:putative protease
VLRPTEEAAVSEQPVGVITHFFPKISVAGISILEGRLAVGDTVYIAGHTTDLRQVIESMQIDKQPVEEAAAGEQVGVHVVDRVRVGDRVFRIAGT